MTLIITKFLKNTLSFFFIGQKRGVIVCIELRLSRIHLSTPLRNFCFPFLSTMLLIFLLDLPQCPPKREQRQAK